MGPYTLAQQGAQVLVVIANSAKIRPKNAYQWDMLLRAHAIHYGCYVVFANRVGQEQGFQFWGGSGVVGPDGSWIQRLEDEPGVLQVSIDLDEIRRVRDDLPLLAEERMNQNR
jgi:predicted amidohydrolase